MRVTPALQGIFAANDRGAAISAIQATPEDAEERQRQDRVIGEFLDSSDALSRASSAVEFAERTYSGEFRGRGGLDSAALLLEDMMTPQSPGSGQIEQSDVENAPRFEAPQDQKAVDDIM